MVDLPGTHADVRATVIASVDERFDTKKEALQAEHNRLLSSTTERNRDSRTYSRQKDVGDDNYYD